MKPRSFLTNGRMYLQRREAFRVRQAVRSSSQRRLSCARNNQANSVTAQLPRVFRLRSIHFPLWIRRASVSAPPSFEKQSVKMFHWDSLTRRYSAYMGPIKDDDLGLDKGSSPGNDRAVRSSRRITYPLTIPEPKRRTAASAKSMPTQARRR